MNSLSRWIRATAPILALLTTGCATMHAPQTARIDDFVGPSNPGNGTAGVAAPARPEPSGDVAAKERPLTLAACVRIAIDENPVLRAAMEGVAAARESVGMARASYYPTLSVDASYRRWETHAFLPEGLAGTGVPPVIGPTDDWSSGLRAGYLLFDSGKRAAELRSARSRHGLAEKDAARIQQDLALAVHQAFYSLLSTIEARSVARQNLARAEAHLRLAREHWEVGAVPQADVIRTQVEVADARLQLVRAESAVGLARGKLNTAMGLPVEMKIDVEPTGEGPASPDTIDVREALDQAIHHRPVLAAALHRLEIARNSIDAAKSSFGPSISAEAGYGYRDSEYLPEDRDWTIGVGVSLPLFEGFKRSHDLSRTKRELAQEDALIRQLVQEVREDVWASYLRLEESYEATQASEALVRDARESMRMTEERYEAGVATATDLLDAQTTLARAEYVQVEARWSYNSSRAAFDRARGTILRNQGTREEVPAVRPQ